MSVTNSPHVASCERVGHNGRMRINLRNHLVPKGYTLSYVARIAMDFMRQKFTDAFNPCYVAPHDGSCLPDFPDLLPFR